MKNLIFIITILVFTCQIYAQKGVKIEAIFAPGISFALNKQDMDKGDALDMDVPFAFNAGVLLGYGITETISFTTGFMFNQHTAAFVDKRTTLPAGGADPVVGEKFSRSAGYIRLPLLLSISGDPNLAAGFFVRAGPHFDLLTGATYKDERMIGYSKYNPDSGLDLKKQVTIYEKDASGALTNTGRKGRVFRDFVIGASVDVGAQIRINDHIKMTVMLHFEASSNPEGDGASSFAHNLNRGDYLITTNPFADASLAATDAVKYNAEITPFDATFPNYSSESDVYETKRDATWNLMAGLQIGVIYTYRKH